MNRGLLRLTLIATVLVLGFVLCLAKKLEAKTYDFIFWYPGGEGTAAQAQPILTTFTDYLNQRTPDNIKFKPLYISDVTSGKKIIQSNKTSLGIISLPVYLESKELREVALLLQTLSLPEKNGTERFYLLTHKGASPSPYDSPVYSPRPYSSLFLKNVIFSNSPMMAAAKLVPTENIMGIIKKIGQDELKAYFLINSFEYETIKNLEALWAQNVTVESTSVPLPSAPLVVFPAPQSKHPFEIIIPILLTMHQDPEGSEILQTLRLHGFQKPDIQVYEKLEKSWLDR